jgi:hypothetical protein
VKHVNSTLSQGEKYAPTMPRATSRLPSEIRHLSGDRGKTNNGLRLGEVQLSNSKNGEHLAGVYRRSARRTVDVDSKRKCVLLYFMRRGGEGLLIAFRRELAAMTPEKLDQGEKVAETLRGG